jgi:hypothetical protein
MFIIRREKRKGAKAQRHGGGVGWLSLILFIWISMVTDLSDEFGKVASKNLFQTFH